MILSWLFLDKLATVSYVEGVMGLSNRISVIGFITGIITLIVAYETP